MFDRYEEIRRAHRASQVCGVVAAIATAFLVVLVALYAEPQDCAHTQRITIGGSMLLAGCPQ